MCTWPGHSRLGPEVPRRLRTVLTLSLTLALAVSCWASAHAQQRTWINPAGGNWFNAANWQGGLIPDTPQEWALLPALSGPYVVTLDADVTVDSVHVGASNLYLYLNDADLVLAGPSGLGNGGTVITLGPAAEVEGAFRNDATGNLLVTGGNALRFSNTSSFINNGSLVVDYNQSYGTTSVTFEGNTTLQGTGNLRLYQVSPYAQLNTAPGAVLTQAAGHTIHGAGDLNAALVNAGEVNADINAAYLYLRGANKTNTGFMKSVSGGGLYVDGVTIANAGGQLLAETGHVWLGNRARIEGGILAANPGWAQITNGSPTLDHVVNQGAFLVRGGDTLTVTGASLTNDGSMVVDYNQSYQSTCAVIDGQVTLQGTGDLRLYQVSPYAQLNTTPGSRLTQAAGHTIHGAGDVNASLTNAGQVNADINAAYLFLRGENKTNAGVMRSTNGGGLYVDGVTIANGGGQILAQSGHVWLGNNARISGGMLGSIGNWAQVTDGNATLDRVANFGNVWIRGGDALTVVGDLTNDGTMVVDYNQSYAATTVTFDGGATLQGSGDLRLNQVSPYAQLNTTPGSVLTQAADHLIHGAGDVHAALVNAGQIHADVNAAYLFLRGQNKTNTGVMRSLNGGGLYVDGVTVTNTGGQILAEGGHVWLGGGARIAGGTLGSTATWAQVTTGNVTFDHVVNQGAVLIRGGDVLTLTGSTLTNNGTVIVDYNQSYAPTRVTLDGNLTLQGTGDLRLNQVGPYAAIDAPLGAVLTQASGHTIHGAGDINAPLRNHGVVSADITAAALNVQTGCFVNHGLVEARNGALLTVSYPDSHCTGGRLAGGAWQVMPNSRINLMGAVIDTVAAEVVLDGQGSFLAKDAGAGDALAGFHRIASEGSFTVRNGKSMVVTAASPFENDGRLAIGKGSLFQVAGAGPPTSATKVGRGAPTAAMGFRQAESGTLHFDVAGEAVGEYGRLLVHGIAQLGGTLSSALLDGYVPALYDTFQVLVADEILGTFSNIESPQFDGLVLTAVYETNRVLLIAYPAAVSAPDPSEALPTELSFTSSGVTGAGATFVVRLPWPATLSLRVYDVLGREVSDLRNGFEAAGVHRYRFGGPDGGGTDRSGVYFGRLEVRIDAGHVVLTRRVVLLR